MDDRLHFGHESRLMRRADRKPSSVWPDISESTLARDSFLGDMLKCVDRMYLELRGVGLAKTYFQKRHFI
jgi:hypothetical protein